MAYPIWQYTYTYERGGNIIKKKISKRYEGYRHMDATDFGELDIG